MKLALASGGKWFCTTFVFAVFCLGVTLTDKDNESDLPFSPSFEQFLLICGCIALITGIARFFFVWEKVEDRRIAKELGESVLEE